MASGFNRAVIGKCAKNRRDQKWLLRALREHQKQKARGGDVTFRRSRHWRLVIGQYLLCKGDDRPIAVVLAPLGAALAYASGAVYYYLHHGVH